MSFMKHPLRLPWSGRLIWSLPVNDVVLALALGVLAVGGLLTGQVMERPLIATLPIAVTSTAVIAVRRSLPLTATAVVSILAVAQSLLAGHSSSTLWALVVFLVCVYTVAAERSEGYALFGLAIVLASQFICEWLEGGTDYAFDVLVFGGVWLFGRGTHSWKEQAIRAEQHRHDLARIAVAQERIRIARELHDVVAHSLSVIAVQADAAEAALLKDPARAVPPMKAIRGSAREALGDMRQLLRVLRTEGSAEAGPADGALSPAHGMDDLDQLVATMRESGLDLQVDISRIAPVSQGTELAVFRIVQEALTNVRKHAGTARCRLRIYGDEDQVCIQIENDAPSGKRELNITEELSTGNGLLGIRERVSAAGGTLLAGPTDAGGFTVSATLPARQKRDIP